MGRRLREERDAERLVDPKPPHGGRLCARNKAGTLSSSHSFDLARGPNYISSIRPKLFEKVLTTFLIKNLLSSRLKAARKTESSNWVFLLLNF